MSEYWDPSEYWSDLFEDNENAWLQFTIKVCFDDQKNLSDSYLIETNKNNCNYLNLLTSVDIGINCPEYKYDNKNGFIIRNKYGLDYNETINIMTFMLHDDLVEFIKGYFPYLYNVIILPLICNDSDTTEMEDEIKNSIIPLCHNLFCALNNKDSKILLEHYLAKKYNCRNVEVQLFYKECCEEQFWGGEDVDIKNVTYECTNCLFPAVQRKLKRVVAKEIINKVNFYDFVTGYYLYAIDGVKNVQIMCVGSNIEVEADVVAFLKEEGPNSSDFYKLKTCVFKILGKEYDYTRDETFVDDWVNNATMIAIYLMIRHSKHLNEKFEKAKHDFINRLKK